MLLLKSISQSHTRDMNSLTSQTTNNGGQSRKRGNFDSVPADDGFRNYMARKIELQRKQFGLVLPPPPPPPSPPVETLKTSSTRAEASNIDRISHSKDASLTNNPARVEKKSVRFHDNVEVEGVSQLLSNLKQKYTRKKKISRLSSAYKRRRQVNNEPLDSSKLSADDNSQSISEPPTIGYTSVLGVLNNLQRRHGTSSILRKRLHSQENSPETQGDGQSSGIHGVSVLESLECAESVDFAEIGNPFSNLSTGRLEGGNRIGSADASSKKRRENTRCKGSSVLELLKPDPGGKKESSADAFHNQQRPPDQQIEVSKGSISEVSVLMPSRQSEHSHASSHSPIHDSQIIFPRETSATSVISSPIQTESTSTKLGMKPNHRPDLFFTGVVVLVNGHTSPDATTLMRLLHKHGGDLEKYETRRVTHIIAEQLSAAKAKIYKQQRKPTPICRPQWIVDSVARGMLLPFGDYLLKNVLSDDVVGTKSVTSFFVKNPDRNDASTSAEIGGGNAQSRESQGFELDGKLSSHEDNRSESTTTDETKFHRWQDTLPSQASYHLSGQVRTVGNDPNFLESYFRNSRLSFIGSFKQRVKPSKQACRSQSKEGARMFVLLVDMDFFFAAVALRKYPEYRDKPVAVGHSHVARSKSSTSKATANSSSELSTCNYIARKYGIRKRMFLGDAIQLCPGLIVLPYDFEGYEEVSGTVATLLDSFAEQFNGCIEQVSCDESYVEININEDDCGGNDVFEFVHKLAEHLRADIVKETECTASIGVGPNKMLAKLAADRVKPDASFVVKDWREFLNERGLRDIPGIGRKLENKLQQHGVRTVNDIWELENDAVNVLGDVIGYGNAQKIVQYCYGKDNRPVTPAPRKSISAECNYGVRFDGPYGVDYMMKGLANEVEKRMDDQRCRGTKLTLKVMKSREASKVPGKFLGHGLCDNHSRCIDIPLTRDADVILSAAMKLHEKLGIDASAIRGMGIVISSLKSDGGVSVADPSSPSKLSAWLKKATPLANESPEGQTSQQGTIFELEIDESHPPILDAAKSASSTIPTFSQLDQDVLRNLPDDILSEVRCMYGKSPREQTSSGKVSPSKSPKSKASGKVSVKDKPIPIIGQASVRRMLKLASIKSGAEDLVGHRLSQLECLPLEVQLQIANEDDVTITKRPKLNACTADHQTATVEMMHVEQPQHDAAEFTSIDDRKGFYRENIGPLRDFISSNPNPDSMTVEIVRNFLSLCVQERRVDDAVVLLRTMKNMHDDSWGDEIYSQFRKSTLDEIYSTTGCPIDTEWLGI